MLPLQNLSYVGGDFEVNAQGGEVCFAAIDLLVFNASSCVAIVSALSLSNQIELLISFSYHCPIGIVITQRCRDNKPAR
jgi:hypothetical protein